MKPKRIIRHITFWVIWLLSMSVFYGMNPKGNMFLHSFTNLSLGLPIYLFYCYLTVYKIIPLTVFRKKIFIFFVYLIFSSFVFAFLLRLNTRFVFYRFFDAQDAESIDLTNWFPVLTNMVWVNVPLFMFASVKYIYDYYGEISRKKELEKQNLQAELSLLMIQLRPHFLFNTLNNLYSMALSGDSNTSEGLAKIINMLKYILFKCSEDEVDLQKEISLIEDYIELERMRYDKRLEFSFEKKIEDPKIRIVPMILFTFVENSFKHGSSPEAGTSFIHISLKADRQKILFKSENSFPQLKDRENSKGLGLENVRKRLELLYPGEYNLQISKKHNVFNVSLELNSKGV